MALPGKKKKIKPWLAQQIPVQRHFLGPHAWHKKIKELEPRDTVPSLPAANLENIPLSSPREKDPKHYDSYARIANDHLSQVPTQPNPSTGPAPTARRCITVAQITCTFTKPSSRIISG